MDRRISCCGLVCAECPAFVARKRNEANCAAATWSEMYDAEIRPEDMNCDGYIVPAGVHFRYCQECEVRQCSIECGVDDCAHCADYACDKLARIHEAVPAARTNLNQIRERLGS